MNLLILFGYHKISGINKINKFFTSDHHKFRRFYMKYSTFSDYCRGYLKASVAIAAIVAVPMVISFAAPSLAQSKKVVFKPPSGSAPKTTTGAATRDIGSCLRDSSSDSKKTMAILPQSRYGLTIASHPELLIYKNKTSAKQMLFSLRDDAGEQVYQTFLPVPSVSGVVAISMPEEAPELTVNKKYKWTVAIICGKSLRPDSPTIEGWIQRVPESSSLTSKLQSANPLEKIALYGENGLWYDLVSSLNKLRIASPSDQYLSKAWEELIKDNGIKSVERTSLAN